MTVAVVRSLSILYICSVPAGCMRAQSEDDAEAADEVAAASIDVVESSYGDGALVAATLEVVTPTGATPDDAAAAAAGAATDEYSPSSCVTATVTGSTIHYDLNGCTGPFGVLDVRGGVDVTLISGADGLEADAVATDLDVSGAHLDVRAHGKMQPGSERALAVDTMGSGTGARGTAFDRMGSYVVGRTADGCVALDGSWSTAIGDRSWSTRTSGYRRCGGACPSSGAIEITGGLSGETLTVTFDGTATAAWSTSRGRSGGVDLACSGG